MSAGSRLVLRVRAVDLELTNGHKSPVWIGSVVEERLYHPLELLTLVSTQPAVNAPRQALAEALEEGRIVPMMEGLPTPDWDGRTLLARQSEAQGMKSE